MKKHRIHFPAGMILAVYWLAATASERMAIDVHHEFEPRGACAELFFCVAPEVLLEGPAGTGKSRASGELILDAATQYPGCRQAVVRKTRVSLTESWLVTWENKVLSDGVDRTYLAQPLSEGPGRANRHVYEFKNGSSVVIAGLDRPTRLFSTEFDRIWVVEAQETTEDDWESLNRALRNGKMPFQQLGGECNPDSERHWLNMRCNAGRTTRIVTRHADNPSLSPEYLERLSNLTGTRRARLFEGKWVSAEGLIWDVWDQHVHMVDAPPTHDNVKWCLFSIDWGFRNPGCVQVWQVTNDDVAHRVCEVYRSHEDIEWWAERVVELYKEFRPRVIVADPAEPGHIKLLNDKIGPIVSREVPRIVIEADNEWMAGANLVRDQLNPHRKGGPRMKFVRNCHRYIDGDRLSDRKTVCFEDEVVGYVYEKTKDGRPIKEREDKTVDAHACDCTRYAAMHIWGRDLGETKKPSYPSRSYGDLLRHDDVWEEIRRENELMEERDI